MATSYSIDIIKMLISQAQSLLCNINRSLNDSATNAPGRYVSFKTYAKTYNNIARQAETVLGFSKGSFSVYNTDEMASHMDTLWPIQKEIMESVALETDILLTYLEKATDYAEDKFENIANFIKSSLRASMFSIPDKEKEVQDNIERLFIGKGLLKGIDYDRETGKLEFSGKEYIPDFVLPKLSLCIEVKLVKEGRRSKIIDEINADITAYSTKYDRLLFVVYDLGVIRDENEFRRDIENSGANIKVVIVKQ